MRFVWLLVIVGSCCLSGCTAGRLRQRTVNQGSTLPELQYQQVLHNLAMFATNPSALPWHVNIREGTTQVTDSASAGALVDLGPPAVTQPQAFGTRTAVAQWGMAPVIDSIELRLLRTAYRRAFGSDEMPEPDVIEELAHELKDQLALNVDLRNESEVFYEYKSEHASSYDQFRKSVVTANDDAFFAESLDEGREVSPLAKNVTRKLEQIQRDLERIGPGWFGVGGKHDVPKCACYVGHDGDTYVWVEADGREELTEFTLIVMKLSSLLKETQTLINPGSVKFSPGDRPG